MIEKIKLMEPSTVVWGDNPETWEVYLERNSYDAENVAYKVKLRIANQYFALDYDGERKECEWYADQLINALAKMYRANVRHRAYPKTEQPDDGQALRTAMDNDQ